MRPDKTDEHHAPVIVRRHYKSIRIPLDVENHSIICNETGIAVRRFNLGWCGPIGPTGVGIP